MHTATKPVKEVLNPFADEYFEQEVAFYGLKEPYEYDGLEVSLHCPRGILPDYFNRNFRVTKTEVPMLLIDHQLWMSLTYMELQSAFLPVRRAGGTVAVLGLGLGYYTLKVMETNNVDKVHIFENDPRILNYFQKTFSHRDGFEKCEFHLGDARKTFHGFHIDYCWSDIYPTLCSDTMLTDRTFFMGENDIQFYDFWSQELILLSAHIENLRPHLEPDEINLFKMWAKTELFLGDRKYCPIDMYEGIEDHEYLQHALKVMERV